MFVPASLSGAWYGQGARKLALMYATLFDFDGVLVDSEPVHLAAFNDVLAPQGIELAHHEYVERYLSLDDAGVFRDALSRRQRTLREEEVRALVEAKHPRFLARFADSFRVFPGAVELLARRAERGPVGIVSGALHEEITFALDRMAARSASSSAPSGRPPRSPIPRRTCSASTSCDAWDTTAASSWSRTPRGASCPRRRRPCAAWRLRTRAGTTSCRAREPTPSPPISSR